MATITVHRRIQVPSETIWKVISDFGAISKFNPYLKHSELLEGSAECGLGTERQCDMKIGGSYMRERVIDWQEGASYTVDIYESPLPIKNIRTTLRIHPLNVGLCEVYMSSNYEPRFGFFGKVLDLLILRWMMRYMFAGMLKGLEKYVTRTPDLTP